MNNPLSAAPFSLGNHFYDLLYSNKDYANEAHYVSQTIKDANPQSKDLLELGCGTGNYSKELCSLGYNVTGIERSKEMVSLARSKSIEGLSLVIDDITSFTLDKKFDAVVSLFHVISYLNKNEEILSCFNKVAMHLKGGGIFLFDVWYTPAVYCQGPTMRTREIENEHFKITRIAKPNILYQQNVVEVDYSMEIQSKADNQYRVVEERHSMRHFSTPEIEFFAKQSGFVLIRSEEFLTAKEPSSNTWGVCYILQKND